MMRRQDSLPDETELGEDRPVNRLCNEIRLFDLCEREQCSYKSGNFCTNGELLTRFEKIAEDEVRCQIHDSDGDDEDLDEDDDGFGGGFDDEFDEDSGDFDQD